MTETAVALVGLGAAAQAIWVPALQRIQAKVVAGADPDPVRRRAFGSLVPHASVHPDLRVLLAEHPAARWIVVAAPPAAHGELIAEALGAGRNVLCEKPFVPDLATADRLIQQAAERGCALAVNHEFARLPIFAATLGRIAEGGEGRLLFAELQQRVDDGEARGWRAEGATLHEFGTHAIDLLLRAFGGPPGLVTARMPRPRLERRGDPIDLVALEWADGRAAQLTLCRISPGRHRYFEGRFDCELASLRCSVGGRAAVQLGFDAQRRRPSLRLDLAGGGQAWVERGAKRTVYARDPLHALIPATASLAQETFAAASMGAPLPCGAATARVVLAVVDAAYRSAAEGRTVELA